MHKDQSRTGPVLWTFDRSCPGPSPGPTQKGSKDRTGPDPATLVLEASEWLNNYCSGTFSHFQGHQMPRYLVLFSGFLRLLEAPGEGTTELQQS